MKKYLSIILAVLVGISVLTGCTKQNDMPDNAFNKEDYQKLLALRFDGYEDMTVSEYQNKVWELTDTTEYRNLLERFSKDETLYKMKDSDETASFLFNVLEPLTAEHWQTRDYSGSATSDFPFPAENATLEYTFTLTILNADVLTVKEYNDMRLGVINKMQDVLKNKTKEELRNEIVMQAEIQTYVDDTLQYMQTPEIGVEIEYAYFPLSVTNEEQQNTVYDSSDENEKRRYSNGTEEDYRSLLALKTTDYQNMTLIDFNMALLAWANEDYERTERISEDTAWNDFRVNLTNEELSFVKLTVFLSGMENGKYIQSNYTGQEEVNFIYDEYLPQKTIAENGNAAWCSLYYQFSYSINHPQNITVGERDNCIDEMINAVHEFWNNTDIEDMLQMNEEDIVIKLQTIAMVHSTDDITISTGEEQIHFERMDERQFIN
jgi:hypothetical protein